MPKVYKEQFNRAVNRTSGLNPKEKQYVKERFSHDLKHDGLSEREYDRQMYKTISGRKSLKVDQHDTLDSKDFKHLEESLGKEFEK